MWAKCLAEELTCLLLLFLEKMDRGDSGSRSDFWSPCSGAPAWFSGGSWPVPGTAQAELWKLVVVKCVLDLAHTHPLLKF